MNVDSCKDELPIEMTSNGDCKSLSKKCSDLKSKCYNALGYVFGRTGKESNCKDALGNKIRTKVKDYCKITCKQCG